MFQLPERDAIAIEGEARDPLGIGKPGEFAVFVREDDGVGWAAMPNACSGTHAQG